MPRGLEQPGFDAAVCLNGPAEVGGELRKALPDQVPLLLWTQHAHDQPALAALTDPVARGAWDGFLCVSDWQAGCLIDTFGLDPAGIRVVRNAIGPRFEGLFSNEDDLIEAKCGGARVAYTSTPFRGLDVLLHAFGATHGPLPRGGPRRLLQHGRVSGLGGSGPMLRAVCGLPRHARG